MKPSESTEPVREAVGVFFKADSLEAAIGELLSSGFDDEHVGLLAGEHTVRQDLGHLYTDTNASLGNPEAPRVAFVRNESMGDTVHAWVGGLFFAGATAAGGTAVVSAAVLGGAVLAALAGVAAVGAVGAVLAMIIHQSDAEYLEEQIDEGHVLLFVRTLDPERERLALEILARHSKFDVKVYTVQSPSPED
jgi:hypothetical protein